MHHKPCNQCMWTNAKIVEQEMKISPKRKIFCPQICDFSLLLLWCIFKNTIKLSDLSQVALIYQEPL